MIDFCKRTPQKACKISAWGGGQSLLNKYIFLKNCREKNSFFWGHLAKFLSLGSLSNLSSSAGKDLSFFTSKRRTDREGSFFKQL